LEIPKAGQRWEKIGVAVALNRDVDRTDPLYYSAMAGGRGNAPCQSEAGCARTSPCLARRVRAVDMSLRKGCITID
jgi:hypothetical protein